MTKIWTWIRNNPGTILNVAIVVIGIVIAVIDMIGRASPEAVREATLALLSLIGASLLVNRAAYTRLRQWIEDILNTRQSPPQVKSLSHIRDFGTRLKRSWDMRGEKCGYDLAPAPVSGGISEISSSNCSRMTTVLSG